MGCCLQRENLPPTDLFTSKRFYQHKISTFRNNCPSGWVLLGPNFVKLGRRVLFILGCQLPVFPHITYVSKDQSEDRITATLTNQRPAVKLTSSSQSLSLKAQLSRARSPVPVSYCGSRFRSRYISNNSIGKSAMSNWDRYIS